MKTPPMMECGHTANAVRQSDNAPVCAICTMIRPGYDVVAEPPDLTGRLARCSYDHPGQGSIGRSRRGRRMHTDGDSVRPTDLTLAFLELRPDDGWRGSGYDTTAWDEYDRYYCGCWGWD